MFKVGWNIQLSFSAYNNCTEVNAVHGLHVLRVYLMICINKDSAFKRYLEAKLTITAIDDYRILLWLNRNNTQYKRLFQYMLYVNLFT